MNSLSVRTTEIPGYALVNGLKMYYEIEGTVIRSFIFLQLLDSPG
jgi:hypothetical protein